MGELFLNLIFVLIVPLVFFSISAAVCKMSGTGRLGCLLLTIIGVFFVMTVIAALLSYLSTLLFDPSETSTAAACYHRPPNRGMACPAA